MDRETLVEMSGNENLLFMDEYDAAICGVVSRCGQDDIVCYDLEKVIEISIEMGMSEEDAWDHFGYNQLGSWVGENTPCFLRRTECEW